MSRVRAISKPILRRKSSLKKTLPQAVAQIQAEHPDASVEVWGEDEHRIGLKPILRRVWCKKGQRPLVTVQPRYKWIYLYGFVCPDSGQSFWLLLPRVAVAVWTLVLAEFAAAVGAGESKQIVLVIDQAGWHRSDTVVVPQGVHVVFQPAYSPEVQPAERLWTLSDEALVNECFSDLDGLIEAQTERCRRLCEQPEIIRTHTLFHWWPKVAIP